MLSEKAAMLIQEYSLSPATPRRGTYRPDQASTALTKVGISPARACLISCVNGLFKWYNLLLYNELLTLAESDYTAFQTGSTATDYSLRHSFATHLLENGNAIFSVFLA
jgi:hypothetical protein